MDVMKQARTFGHANWTIPLWTTREEIVGALAKWAVQQSPWGPLPGLEVVLAHLHQELAVAMTWDRHGLARLTLAGIEDLLRRALMNFPPFQAWNERRLGHPAHPFNGTFIDLGALIRNAVVDIRDAHCRRQDFDLAFDREFFDRERGDGSSQPE